MCGIVGYLGDRNITEVLIESLKRLEYRGYDSAGIAVIQNNEIIIRRNKGKIKELEKLLDKETISGQVGIGHTRWATHGKPSECNAHPHRSGKIAVVHNGIIENYIELKEKLSREGRLFCTETDTEVIAHLVDQFISKGEDFEQAVIKSIKLVSGSYAVALINSEEPDKIIAVKNSSPLIVGIGDNESFLASDIPAILPYTKNIIIIKDNEIAIITRNGVKIKDLEGKEIKREFSTISWDPVMAEKCGYKHFMLKEIYEQPTAVTNTLIGRLSPDDDEVFLENINPEIFLDINKIYIVACGTAWHASLVGKFILEGLTRIPTEVDYSSEFRYRNPIVDSKTLIIPVSQSGETADTLGALREGKKLGGKIVSICNVVDSSVARESHAVIYTHAGPEIGVASTKAFVTQLTVLYLLGLYIGVLRKKIDKEKLKNLIHDLKKIPTLIEEVLGEADHIKNIAKTYVQSTNFLYLGRGIHYPIALEGALKLKEISYIHAEGYPAGEMKHGPIALIDSNMPVVALAPSDTTYEKMVSNIEQVKARDGKVIALVTKGNLELCSKSDYIINVPKSNFWLTPLLFSVPLQLFAYFLADFKGTDVDQPRNLAKSVTVE